MSEDLIIPPVSNENSTIVPPKPGLSSKKKPLPSTDPKVIALQVLRAINKSKSTSIQLDCVPYEFLTGEVIDLHKWTMILTDANLKTISNMNNEQHWIDCTKETVPSMFWNFFNKVNFKQSLTNLNISNAKDICDHGLSLIARQHTNLKFLNISGCPKITDSSIREIGMNCTSIQEINMSGCIGIDGTGLVAVAECCPYLLKLNISKCRNLQRWSLTKIFYKCIRLEVVDCSYLQEIADEEIRILAQNCPHMCTFIAKESPFISDQSIGVLAQYCSELDYIDVSRSSHTFRISDVSLLSLGEQSKSLRTLKINGCDQVSDVGLNWLSDGCHALEELELIGLTKISDAGLRSLGNKCHSLTSLNISHALLVSDVGLNSVSTGCPLLKKMICNGQYLLSDPRLSAPKKSGGKPDAWQSVVGVAALAMYCPLLEEVDLTGSFRLNLSVKHNLSSLKNLRNICLKGCNQVETESLISLAKNCKLIEELNLSDCGKAVCNSSVQAFASNCINLKTVILHRCEQVRAGAIKGLSRCEKLVKLDLTSCKSLTDIMLLSLTEVDTVPALRTLILVGNRLLTDATLAWLASKDQNILLLAVLGTGITRASVQAVRDRFAYSDMIENENFFGFWPQARVEDRKIMNKYFVVADGIVKIQARQRAHLAKIRCSGITMVRRKAAAVITLQTICKIFNAKMKCHALRKIRDRIHHSAMLITSVCWMAVAHGKVKRRKKYLYDIYWLKCLVKVQSTYRMHAQILIRKHKEMLHRMYLQRCEIGAIKMQSVARLYFAKNKVLHIKKMIQSRKELVERKINFLLRICRGHLGRKRAKERFIEVFRLTILRLKSTKQVQAAYRLYRTRKKIRKARELRLLRWRSAIKMQSVMRGALARIFYAEVKYADYEIIADKASKLIQNRWYIKKAILELKERKKKKAIGLATRIFHTIVLQKYVRAKFAKKIFKKKKEAYLKRLNMRVELEIWSAVRIQAWLRGIKGRERFVQMLVDKKGKWKELYDEEKGRRFFYNKLTSEIRWRMPQDLLDLIPRPGCDNNCNCPGDVECAVCNEVFCHSCWDAIHFGGRRKDHEFRALYDYYGKRLDFGDGVFPCKWPSELLQDEVQGWMLRVAPIRDPTAIYNDWEEYKDVDENGAQGRTFYFNRVSFETTYDTPQEVTYQLNPYNDYDPQYYYDENLGTWMNSNNTPYIHNQQQWDQTGGDFGQTDDYLQVEPQSYDTGHYDNTGNQEYENTRNYDIRSNYQQPSTPQQQLEYSYGGYDTRLTSPNKSTKLDKSFKKESKFAKTKRLKQEENREHEIAAASKSYSNNKDYKPEETNAKVKPKLARTGIPGY